MDLVSILIALVIIGAVLYILQLLPIDGTIKRVIQVIAIVVVIVWALRVLLPMAGL